MRPLQPGAEGPDVRILQETLRGKGYDIPVGEWERHYFGPGTELALNMASAAVAPPLGDYDLRPKARRIGTATGVLAGVVGVVLAVASWPLARALQDLSLTLALTVIGLVLGIVATFSRVGRAFGVLAIIFNTLAGGFWWLISAVSYSHGRPFRRRGRVVTAPVERGAEWVAPSLKLRVDHLSTEDRARLADRWLAAARSEHASVAAFAALSLDLLAHGAPPSLLEATQRAALDEIRHAQLGFAVAAAYAGRAHSPARWPDATAPRASRDLVRESLLDGCFNEGTSARMIAADAAGCDDAELRRILISIAEDEARHAELGWAIVEWRLAVDPRASDSLARALDELRRHPDSFGVIQEIEARAWPLLDTRRAA